MQLAELPRMSAKRNGQDRLPPHSMEAERAVLGCILLDPRAALPVCQERLTADAFYDLRNRTIYESLVQMSECGISVDCVTLFAKLTDAGKLEAVGGATYLSELPDAAPTALHVESYVQVLTEKLTLRRVIRSCSEAASRAYDNPEQPEAVLDDLERSVMGIAQRSVRTESLIGPLTVDAMHRIEESHGRAGMLTGIGTGFIDFDVLTSGLQNGDLIVVASRPSVGKTSWSLNVADHVACELGLPVGIISLEMTAGSLAVRLLTSRARVNLRNIAAGFLVERDVPRLISAASRLKKSTIVIDDSSSMTILQLKAKARRMAQRHGIRLLIVDYIQLVLSGRRSDGRQQEVSDVSAGLKALAKELNVPVVALSQLSRSLDKEKRRPVLADLRESGAIEQDADVVAFLHKRKKNDDDNDDYNDGKRVDLIVAKQRNGRADVTVDLVFIPEYTRFENAAKISVEDEPQKERQIWTDKM